MGTEIQSEESHPGAECSHPTEHEHEHCMLREIRPVAAFHALFRLDMQL